MAAAAKMTHASARRPLRRMMAAPTRPITKTGVNVSRPRPDSSRSTAAPGRGVVMPKKPSELRPSTAWPLRPGTATASE